MQAERHLHLVDSLVVGIESGKRPTLVDSSCRASRKTGTTESCGVCGGN